MINAKKIMILEDNLNDQFLLKRQVLKFAPNSILTLARDKFSFFEKINWFLPDLILADFNLLNFTGMEALLYIKEHKPYIPFVFVTGTLQKSDKIFPRISKIADGLFFKDNLKELPQQLEVLLKKLERKIEKNSRLVHHQYDQKIKIEKAKSLILKSEQCSNQSEILAIMNEIEQGMEMASHLSSNFSKKS